MIERPRRVVIDTNVFVSAILRSDSVAARAVNRALSIDTVLTSREVLSELSEVLLRPKFARTRTLAQRQDLVRQYTAALDPVEVSEIVGDCRDPRDNMFLALALGGNADLIVTGDEDLLVLHPWRGVSIFTPAQYLESLR